MLEKRQGTQSVIRAVTTQGGYLVSESVATLLWNTQLRTQIGRDTYIFLLDITTTGKTGKLGNLSINA